MENIQNFDGEVIASGLTQAEVQAVARRQLVASVAVAIVIGLGLVVTAMAPASHIRTATAAHRIAGVQQPTFVHGAEHFAAVKQGGIELP